MSTFRLPLLTWSSVPDTSGNVWIEPLDIAATNDVWDHLVWRFKDTATRIGLRGSANIPKNYNSSGTTALIVVWSSTATSGDVEWDFDYRAVGGNDSESLDQAGTQESVNLNDTAPGAAWRRLECSITLTASNLAADDTLQFEVFRDGTDGGDTMAADAYMFGLFLQYTD
jgi:hypothetical protein